MKLNLHEGRSKDVSSWIYPWGHILAQGIYPLLVTQEQRFLPIGTAFCVSSIGIMASALHNIEEAVRYHCRGDELLRLPRLPEQYHLHDIGLAVFYQRRQDSGGQVATLPLEGIQGAPPTDVVYGATQFQQSFPYLPLPISFKVPRIGSRVTSVGFSDAQFPDEGISFDAVQSGEWMALYQAKLLAVEAQVGVPGVIAGKFTVTPTRRSSPICS